MQPTELLDDVRSRTEVKVVRVREHDGRTERAHFVGMERLHRRLRPDGHERGRRDLAVRGPEHAGAGGAVGRSDAEAHRISIASPKE